MILDTLLSRGAPATFFVIGENVEAHIPLMRREYREGHEVGNHTFTHPNLSLTSDARTKVELDLDARAIEAAVDRRSAFFRPPYFGDAAPTTPDELDPVSLASRRGYYTIGLRDDSEDWQPLPVATIIHNVLAARDSGNIVLLHDGGGDRSRTVAALGTIIDSLRARGDTLVLVSDLAGLSRDAAMPPLPALSEARRLLELLGFGALGVGEWVLYWVFFTAVILGIARLLVVGALAVAQRLLAPARDEEPAFAPPVSVVVPAYNEGRVIIGTVASLLRQRYAGPIEIVVVDDGSTDDTAAVARDAFGDEAQVVVLTKRNGGKASALNHGIERASHDVVVCLDADTVFATDAIANLVPPLADPAVGAVAGNAKVGNRVNLVTRWQALEYVTSQNFDRRAFALVNGITVVPGAVGAWRRSLVRALGGFRGDTLAEDQDLTLRVRRAGYRIAYAADAVAYTEAPDTLGALAKQRFRWSFGTLQCAWKHRDALLRPRYGSLGLVALPNTWLFQLLLPAISPIADLMFVLSLVSVALTYDAHGATYALASLEQVLLYYAVFLVADWLAAVIAFLMEPGEERRLTWLIFLQRFAYRQVMYWVVVRAFKAAFSGRVVGWGKLERKATVEAPA
jgi:cellulose synthase/poly-beta-1,6-N-acetylglucosamine synthase-like glycosyltransferase